MANKLDKPLYHGTSNAASILIDAGHGFNAPIHLTTDKERAIHYAKAATAYLESKAKENGKWLIADGYAIFTFHTLPNIKYLSPDTYSNAEPDQFVYSEQIRKMAYYTVERHKLQVDESERLRLICFAIGMWRR